MARFRNFSITLRTRILFKLLRIKIEYSVENFITYFQRATVTLLRSSDLSFVVLLAPLLRCFLVHFFVLVHLTFILSHVSFEGTFKISKCNVALTVRDAWTKNWKSPESFGRFSSSRARDHFLKTARIYSIRSFVSRKPSLVSSDAAHGSRPSWTSLRGT